MLIDSRPAHYFQVYSQFLEFGRAVVAALKGPALCTSHCRAVIAAIEWVCAWKQLRVYACACHLQIMLCPNPSSVLFPVVSVLSSPSVSKAGAQNENKGDCVCLVQRCSQHNGRAAPLKTEYSKREMFWGLHFYLALRQLLMVLNPICVTSRWWGASVCGPG